MIVRCAWCKKVMSQDEMDGAESHGICHECFIEETRVFEEQKDAKPETATTIWGEVELGENGAG